MWRLIYAIPSWIGFLLFRTVVILLGWILIPIAAAAGAYDKQYDEHKADKGENPIVYFFTWKFMFPWDNWEDGIANDMYWKAPNLFLQIVYWSAFRNPANNLRKVPGLSVHIEKEKVGFVGNLGSDYALTAYDEDHLTFAYFCWHGFYSNFRWQFRFFGKIFRLWIGWKIYPEDSKFEVRGHRKEGAGFGTQFKRCYPR